MKELQKQYDALIKQEKTVKQSISNFTKKLSSQNFIIKNGKIVKNEKVWAAFWDVTYYSHFDGHTSDPIYNIYSGAKILDKKSKKFVDEFMTRWVDMDPSEKIEFLNEGEFVDEIPWEINDHILGLTEEDCDSIDNSLIEHYAGDIVINVNKNSLKFEIRNEDPDQGQLSSGSFIEFKETTLEKIKLIKNKEKKQR